MKNVPSRIWANRLAENIRTFSGVWRACTETMSACSSSWSSEIRSTPGTGSGGGNGSYAVTAKPSASARLATSLPTCPRPTRPSVRPGTSRPKNSRPSNTDSANPPPSSR